MLDAGVRERLIGALICTAIGTFGAAAPAAAQTMDIYRILSSVPGLGLCYDSVI